MWRIFYFAQLPGQYWLFGILFHVLTNCSRFFEHTLAKICWWKLVSYILPNKNEEIFSFFTSFISFKLKKYQHNTNTASCNLFQYSRLVKFYYKMKQPVLHPYLQGEFLKNSWLVIFEEFLRNYSIRCGTVF